MNLEKMKNMKRILLLSLAVLFLSINQSAAFFAEADAFFSANVSNGLVDYKGIKANPADLNALVAEIAEADIESMTGNQKKAFLINTYNILVIWSIVQEYPTGSPLDIDGFFDKKKHNVGGTQMTLSDLETKNIMPTFKDSRLHFALVCAAIGCPPIINEAYLEDMLEEQLDRQTEAAVNSEKFVEHSTFPALLKLSQIFEWYASDFDRDEGTVIKFINKYRSSEIPSNIKIGYTEYDWSLNEQ